MLFSITSAGGITSCAHSSVSKSTEPHVLGTHPDRLSSEYYGEPQVYGAKSKDDLFREYAKNDPDQLIQVRLSQILLDGGKTLKWSSTPIRESYTNNHEMVPIWLRIPPMCHDQSCPVIMEIYAGGGCFNGNYHWRPEFFERAGFIVAQPNIRGSGCLGKAWKEASHGRKKIEALTDIRAAGKFLKKRFNWRGHPPKIGIVGWSYGGFASLIGMSRFAGTFDAGAAIEAKTDLYSFFSHASEDLRKKREYEYGDIKSDPDLYRELSPITFVDQVQGPVLLLLGGHDPKVSLSDADAFVQKLKSRGQDASMMIVLEEGHLAESPDEITFQHAHLIQFFAEKFSYPISMQ